MINRIAKRHRYRSTFFMSKKSHSGGTIYKHIFSIQLPSIITLSEPPKKSTLPNFRNILINKVKQLHASIFENTIVLLDFSSTKKIYADGMIYLFAEIKNLINIKSIKFRCKKSRNSKVNHALYQIGLFKIFNEKFFPQTSYKDVVHWKSCAGTKIIGPVFEEVIPQNSLIGKKADEINLYGVCNEATLNVLHHAYIAQRKLSEVDYQNEAWWMFSQVKDGISSVAICDLGLGIPATLPIKRKSLYDLLCSFSNGDADLIKGAIETPSSRTALDHRGNGLPRIAKLAQETPGASLTIFSNKGTVQIDSNNITGFNSPSEIPGTIILWKFPVGENNEFNLNCQ